MCLAYIIWKKCIFDVFKRFEINIQLLQFDPPTFYYDGVIIISSVLLSASNFRLNAMSFLKEGDWQVHNEYLTKCLAKGQ